METQKPAQGIMVTHDFDDATFYRITCDCGNTDDDIDMSIETDPETQLITVHIDTKVKTAHWKKNFEYDFNDWYYDIAELANGCINRISLAFTALFKGYVEMESYTILPKQSALNVADAIIQGVCKMEATKDANAAKQKSTPKE